MRDVRIDAYILDVLLHDLTGHDHTPAAFLVYLHLWNRTVGAGARSAAASLQQIAEGTGLSKSAVQAAIKRLRRRRLLRVQRKSPTAVPVYFVQRPWAARRKGS